MLKKKYSTPEIPIQKPKAKKKKSVDYSDMSYRPTLKLVGLRVKKDFSGKN